MRTRPLGKSGLVVSVVGLGGNNFGTRLDLAATREVVDAALEEGVTFFDTADIYGESEVVLGQALAAHRDEVVIATKFGMDMRGANGPDFGARSSRRYLRRAVEASLRRLGTDYIDLYQLHIHDGVTPFEEVVEAMSELVREGKVRYLGHSNLPGWQIAHLAHLAAAGVPFVSAQNEYSLLERGVEAEVIPACEHFGLGMLPFFPLASGLLTGKVTRTGGAPAGSRMERRAAKVPPEQYDRIEALTAWGQQNGRSLLEIAIAGLAAQPAVASVIAGATTPDQVRANVAAGAWEPTAAELADIDELAPHRRPA